MKIKTKIFALLTALALMSQTALAVNFTPDRPAIPFPPEGEAGLDYNSFNNFSGNWNLDYPPVNGDERQFLTVKKCATKNIDELEDKFMCDGDIIDTADGEKELGFADGWTNVQDGDILQFELYFHNNAEDPFDGGGDSNPGPNVDAQGVNIGIDFTNQFLPTGFINADNVKYYDDNGNELKYKVGDYWFESNGEPGDLVQTVSDDTSLTPGKTTQWDLELFPEHTKLLMGYKYDPDQDLQTFFADTVPTTKTPIDIKVNTLDRNAVGGGASSAQVYDLELNVKRIYEEEKNRLYINFDKLPGCLRYNGFVWFRAKVKFEEPNYCESLELTPLPITIHAATGDDKIKTPICTPEQKTTKFEVKVNFAKELPEEGYVTLQSTDPKGKIYLDSNPSEELKTDKAITVPFINGKVIGTYTGLGSLLAFYTDESGNYIKTYVDEKGDPITGTSSAKEGVSICQDTIPTCANDCKDICVERPSEMTAGTYMEISAKSIDFYDGDWKDKIIYRVKKENGDLFKGTEEEFLKYIEEKYGITPAKNTSAIQGCDPFVINLLPGNLFNGFSLILGTGDKRKSPPAYDESKSSGHGVTGDSSRVAPPAPKDDRETKPTFIYQYQVDPGLLINSGALNFKLNSVLMAFDYSTFNLSESLKNIKTLFIDDEETKGERDPTATEGTSRTLTPVDKPETTIDSSPGYTMTSDTEVTPLTRADKPETTIDTSGYTIEVTTEDSGIDLELTEVEKSDYTLDYTPAGAGQDITVDYTTPASDGTTLPVATFDPTIVINPTIDQSLIDQNLYQYNYVTAAQDEKVWFYAIEEGEDVLGVYATGTSNESCGEEYDVGAPEDLFCQSMTVKALSTDDGSEVSSVDPDQGTVFEITDVKLKDSMGNPVEVEGHKIEFKYKSLTETDTFSYLPQGSDVLKIGTNDIITVLQNVIHTGEGPITIEVVKIDDEDYIDKFNECKFILPAQDKQVCEDLTLTYEDGKKVAKVGEAHTLKIDVKSNKGEDYPSTVTWYDSTGGDITFPYAEIPGAEDQVTKEKMVVTENGVEVEYTVYTAPYPYEQDPVSIGSKHAGIIGAAIDGEIRDCSDKIDVTEVDIDCLLLSYKIYDMDGNLVSAFKGKPTLLGNQKYIIESDVVHSEDVEGDTVTYESHEGYFVGVFNLGDIIPERETSEEVIAPEAPKKKMPPANDESKNSEREVQVLPATDNSRVAPKAPVKELDNRMAIIEVVAPVAPKAPAATPIDDREVIAPKAPEATPIDDREVITPEATPADDREVIAPKAPTKPQEPLVEVLRDFFEKIVAPDTTEKAPATKLEGVPAGQKVYFIPKEDLAPGLYENAIKMQATGSDPLEEPDCTQYIDLVVPESEEVCQSIKVEQTPWPFDSEAELISINEKESNFGTYDGNFTFTVTKGSDKAKLFTDSALQDKPKTTITTSLEKAVEGVYLGSSLSSAWSVIVKATDEDPTACKYALSYAGPAEKINCEDLDVIKPQTPWVFDEEEDEQEFEIQLSPEGYGFKVHWAVEQTVDGISSFDYTPGLGMLTNTLKNMSEAVKSISIKVDEANDPEGKCEITIPLEKVTKLPPSIKKRVSAGKLSKSRDSGDWDDLINISMDEDKVTYKVEFKAGNAISEVTFKDSFDDGVIKGEKDGEFKYTGKYEIDVDRTGLSDLDEDDIEECDEDGTELEDNGICVDDGDIDDFMDDYTDGKKATFKLDADQIYKITITYEVENNTEIDNDFCENLDPKDGCGEEFENEVEYTTDLEYKDDDDTQVVIICPYILTRTSGDVFFNTALDAGTDVSYCSEQKNIPAPIIKPIEKVQEIVASGTETLLQLPSHDICKFSNTGENFEGYENPLTHFSSTICEMETEVAEDWKVTNVVNQINANIEQLSRWSDANIGGSLASMTDLASVKNKENGVFRLTGQDLQIDGGNSYVIAGDTTTGVPAAQTYIVKDADLIIKSDIIYGQADYSKPKTVPSAAFIVIDGDIIIDADVEELHGTFISIDTNTSDGNPTGKVISKEVSSNQLTIYGSLIGDVTDLFTNRKYVGDVAKDEGSVTIKQTTDFLINTPPGLNQLMDVSQLEVAY